MNRIASLLLLAILLGTTTVWAASFEKITFSWEGGSKKYVHIRATEGKQFGVDWGDGHIDTLMGQMSLMFENEIDCSHSYAKAGTYKVIIYSLEVECHITHLSLVSVGLLVLDVSQAPSLVALSCPDNALTKLDVSKNKALKGLECSNNKLTSLSIAQNAALSEVWCAKNELTALDTHNNKELVTLDCSHNLLADLDLQKNNALSGLNCSYNQLANLAVDPNSKLTCAIYNNNSLEIDELYELEQATKNSNYRVVGQQTLKPVKVKPNAIINLAEYSQCNGVPTEFKVAERDKPTAIDPSVFALTDSKLVFKNKGHFTIEMLNSEIHSVNEFPAKVIASYLVEE